MAADDFPQYSRSQRTGDAGVRVIERLVEQEIGWRFRRNHQEHDFGIDGYLDVVRTDGAVVGKSLAVQIKTGKSHIVKRTEFGFVLRGTRKHLNYFLNYPIPVLLLLVDEATESALWIQISPHTLQIKREDWEITVPLRQRFDSSCVQELNKLAGESTDYIPIVEQMTVIRNAACSMVAVVFLVTKHDIDNCDTTRLKEFFSMFEGVPDALRNIRNKISLVVHGYNDDRRELYEIPEVRNWFSAAENAVLGWPYYWDLTPKARQVRLFFFCTSPIEVSPTSQQGNNIHFSGPIVSRFLVRHFQSLNRFVERYGISESINEEICREVVKAFP